MLWFFSCNDDRPPKKESYLDYANRLLREKSSEQFAVFCEDSKYHILSSMIEEAEFCIEIFVPALPRLRNLEHIANRIDSLRVITYAVDYVFDKSVSDKVRYLPLKLNIDNPSEYVLVDNKMFFLTQNMFLLDGEYLSSHSNVCFNDRIITSKLKDNFEIMWNKFNKEK